MSDTFFKSSLPGDKCEALTLFSQRFDQLPIYGSSSATTPWSNLSNGNSDSPLPHIELIETIFIYFLMTLLG